MKYVEIKDYPLDLAPLPEMSIGAGAVDIERIWAFAKRTATGDMRLIGPKGSAFKIQGKWSVLTRAQFDGLCTFLTSYGTNGFLVSIHDPRVSSSDRVSLRMYAGNIHGEPLFVDHSTGLPRYYRNCTVSFISMKTQNYYEET